MNAMEKLVNRVDHAQQDHPWLAFPVAVWKKFGDDQAGNLAALIAYYGFAALFPLLLVLVTVLDIVLRSNPSLKDKVLDSAFGQFPVIGPQLQHNVHGLNETGPALVIGIILTFLGARGVASAAQNALNTVWGVPMFRRPGFPWSMLRDIVLILAVGIGLLVTTLLSGVAASAAKSLGLGGQVAAIVVSLILNIGVFWYGFRLATAKEIGTREMLPGAVLAAIVWQILQLRRHVPGRAHAVAQLVAVRRVRHRARPAGLALPAGPVHPVRGGGERGRGPAAVAAQPGPAAADPRGSARPGHVRQEPGTPARSRTSRAPSRRTGSTSRPSQPSRPNQPSQPSRAKPAEPAKPREPTPPTRPSPS